MIRRLISAALLIWVIGFVLFVALLPRPTDGRSTDGIIVLTGGPNRIERGLSLLEQHKARRMLVSGVNLAVRRRDFLIMFHAPTKVFDCCVDLGREAVDTRSNGSEAADWVKRHRYKSVRLVTTDWHMRRARFELDQSLPSDVTIVTDAVRSEPDLGILFREYHKYLLRRLAVLLRL